jgi:Kdo2-lipid IVA lauroyltransferase/acyltransferase
MEDRPLSKKIKYGVIYYFVLFLIFLSNLFTRKGWLIVCGFLGKVAFYALPRSRRLVRRHLFVAFGKEKSQEEIRLLSKRTFYMLGKNAGDVIRAQRVRSIRDLDQMLVAHGVENFQKASAKGRGVVFVACHLGAFDLEVTYMALHGYRPNVIGAPLKDRRLNDLVWGFRNAYGAVAVERGKETFRLLKVLKSGGLVALLIDQDTKVKSRFVDFFGMPASTPVGATILALKTGAAVVPTYIHLGEDGMQHMHLLPEIPMEVTGDEEKDIVVNTQNFTRFIEEQVRKYPDQWVWMHERWKTRPGEEIR